MNCRLCGKPRPDYSPDYCNVCHTTIVMDRHRRTTCVTGDLFTDERIAQRADDNYSDYLNRVDNPTRFDPSR